LGAAIVNAAKERSIELGELDSFKTYTGRGASAIVDKKNILLGSERLMKENGVDVSETAAQAAALSSGGKTPVFIAADSVIIGLFAVADVLKSNSKAVVEWLRQSGMEVVMITGDNKRTADAIAGQAGVKKVVAEVLPEGKVYEVKKLQGDGEIVAMVGDGINDAPALAQANIGISIGTGTDIAIEASDITLVGDDLSGLVAAISLSRKTLQTIHQNLFWAFVYNIVLIPVAAGVLYPFYGIEFNPMFAALAMAFSSVSVVSNSLRLKRFKAPQVG
jgi:Cu+-exporting ATPase